MGVERAGAPTDDPGSATADDRGIATTDDRGIAPTDDRGIATAALIVFVGLFMLLAIIGGAFFIYASNSSGASDPTELTISTIKCEVTEYRGDAGVGNVTFALRYRGSGEVDVSNATVEYIEGDHVASYRIGPTDSNNTIHVVNESGEHDPTIAAGVGYSLTVPVEAARGAPLPADATATVELVVDGTAIIDLIRTPGAIGSDTEYVAC